MTGFQTYITFLSPLRVSGNLVFYINIKVLTSGGGGRGSSQCSFPQLCLQSKEQQTRIWFLDLMRVREFGRLKSFWNWYKIHCIGEKMLIYLFLIFVISHIFICFLFLPKYFLLNLFCFVCLFPFVFPQNIFLCSQNLFMVI